MRAACYSTQREATAWRGTTLVFCAGAWRKIITVRAHKAKALDHGQSEERGAKSVNCGAKASLARYCAVPRFAVEEQQRLRKFSLLCDEAISLY